MEQARNNNPVIRLDSLQAVANRIALDQQKAAAAGPLIYADGGYPAAPVISTDQGKTRFLLNPSKGTTDYYGYDLSLTNGGLYRGVVALEQPLLTGPKTRILEEQNQLQSALLSEHSRLTIHQLEKAITDQYLLCQYTLEQQEATRQLLDLLQAQARISSTLAKSALLYQADVQLLQIEADRLQTAIDALDAAYHARLLDLFVLCGIKDTSVVRITRLSLSFIQDSSVSSGFTEQYRLDSLSLTTGQKIFDLRYKPQFSFYISAGLNTAYAPDILQRFGWQAGLKFTQVLFDGHQRQLNDRRVRLLAQTTAWQTDYFNRQNGVRKTKLMSQVRSLDDQQAAIRQQEQAYDKLLQLYKQQVVSGQLSVINYLSVLRSRASLLQDLATIRYNQGTTHQ
ncbi:TolC family protein [Puia sp. P3]|uniref:TolC family protein n=1 Tax=Puia sp. P3 TaxID=3423952 RepID=UPI003D66876B